MPHLYGELDEDAIKARGYELIQHDTEWTAQGAQTKVRNLHKKYIGDMKCTSATKAGTEKNRTKNTRKFKFSALVELRAQDE